jgi:hypothetical protein
VYFGGNNSSQSFNRVHVLRTGGAGGALEWFHPVTRGDPPARRTGHAACLLPDGRTLFIYGGWDPQDETQEVRHRAHTVRP